MGPFGALRSKTEPTPIGAPAELRIDANNLAFKLAFVTMSRGTMADRFH
jgi:hypothetical protein